MPPLRSELDANKTLRASLIQKDEKRIHFNLENEDEILELQVTFELRIKFEFKVFPIYISIINFSQSISLKYIFFHYSLVRRGIIKFRRE